MSEISQFEVREIGLFLKQQRQKSRPEQFPVFAKHHRRRHVPYLTQSDLAELAGVSIAMIEQIESGRYQNLNQAAVLKLSDALNLAPDDQEYLLSLFRKPDHRIPPTHIPDSVRSVVDRAEPNPAVLITPRFDIVYWNNAATSFMTDFAQIPEEQRNVVLSMFCDPMMRQAWVDWAVYAKDLVAGMRMMTSQLPAYRVANLELAAEMSKRDPDFARWWDEAAPTVQPTVVKDFQHPKLGLLRLYQTVSQVLGAEHLSIIQFTARDEETQRALDQL